MNESKLWARYTLKFKLEAVRLVKGGLNAAPGLPLAHMPQLDQPGTFGDVVQDFLER